MSDFVSVAEAARALSVDPSRVRALAAAEQLPAVKIGNQWAIDKAAVVDRSMRAPQRGRPLAPANAWAVLFLASGEKAEWVSPQGRSRLRRSLRFEGLEGMQQRLWGRARVRDYRAHPGEIPYALEDASLVASSITAAGALDLDLVAGSEVDGYISEERRDAFVLRHALRPAGRGNRGNVRLRVVPTDAWHLVGPVAPKAAVALDLLEDLDPRSSRAGEVLLRRVSDTEEMR